MMFRTRRKTERDLKSILAVARALPEWFDKDARLRALPVDVRHQQGYVAVAGRRVVGFMTFYVAEGRLQIGWLGVRPEFHRRGVGTALLKCAEREAANRGVSELSVYTLGAGVDYKPYEATRAFYFRNGFEVYRTSKTDSPSCPEEIEIKKRVRAPGARPPRIWAEVLCNRRANYRF